MHALSLSLSLSHTHTHTHTLISRCVDVYTHPLSPTLHYNLIGQSDLFHKSGYRLMKQEHYNNTGNCTWGRLQYIWSIMQPCWLVTTGAMLGYTRRIQPSLFTSILSYIIHIPQKRNNFISISQTLFFLTLRMSHSDHSSPMSIHSPLHVISCCVSDT